MSNAIDRRCQTCRWEPEWEPYEPVLKDMTNMQIGVCRWPLPFWFEIDLSDARFTRADNRAEPGKDCEAWEPKEADHEP